MSEGEEWPRTVEQPPNNARHRIAATLRMLLNLKGHILAARGELWR
ncbi:MAG: hypothetical protein HY296_08345 [Thaumarchaeota archaeon]|nr:hypothetical protein [Nitrososphaerota archaeon]